MADKAPSTQILLYQTEDRRTRIEVRLENETVWLNQLQMAELFQTSKQNVSLHIQNMFEERELEEGSVVKEYLTTAADGKSYRTKFYNLDVIISVGYRVKSPPRDAVPHLGHPATAGVPHQGLHPRRRAAQAGGRRQLLRRTARPHPRHPLVGEGLLAEGARHLLPPASTTTRVPRRRSGSSRPCRTRCTGRPTATRRPRSLPTGPTRPGRTWDSPAGAAAGSGRPT